MIVIATMLLSLAAFMPMSNAAPSSNVTQPNLDKLAPALRANIEANPTGDNRIIVVLKTGVSKASALNRITSLGGTVNAQYNIINAISVTLSADEIPPLTALADVDKVLVDGKKYLPIDPLGDDSGSQPVPGPDPTAYYAQFPFWIGADQAWNLGITGTGVVVADLDTGIWYDHPDLAGVVTDYKIFTSEADTPIHDGNGHGTATTGLVAAQGILDYGFFKVLGVAYGAKVIGGKVLTDAGWGWDSWIINGIDWAVADGANIITMSLGGLEVPNDGYDPTCLALDAASKQGVTCFVATGNSQGAGTVSSPSCAEDVISVGASTENSDIWNVVYYWPTRPTVVTGYENDQLIFWSSGGATEDGRLDPDLCAPGAWGETLDTYPYYLWLQFGGTSMATPVAAGVGALVYQAYKQAHGVFPSPATVKEILMNTAKDLGYPANRQGAGRVDALKAVQAALTATPYSDTDYISKMIPAGQGYKTSSIFTDTINTAQAVTLQWLDSVSFTGLTVLRGSDDFDATNNYWLTFTIPAGVEFADVRVKFPPELAYGTLIHSYAGPTWKDAHINTALHFARNGDPNDLILINYAYAHTNVQWLDARIDFGPGNYVLRFWNTGGVDVTITPVDVQVNFYKFVPWNWVSTTIMGKKLVTSISVPKATAPGIYSGFVKVTCNGSPVDIPIVTTVPAKLGQTFTVQANQMLEPRTGGSGDWFYIPVQAFARGNIMLTISWTTPDADFDAYLVNPIGQGRAVNPIGQVRASSYAPSVPVYYTGGGGRRWYTTTGTTMEILSTFCLFPGYWYVGIHAIYFGNTFSQTVTVELDNGKPIDAPCFLNVKKGTSKTFTVSNNIPGTVNVQMMALQLATETYTMSATGTVYSFNSTAGTTGYVEIDWPVTPDMMTMKVSLSWAGSHALSLVLWDPAGRNVGDTFTNPGSLTVINPAVGWWGAIITINDVGSQAFTLTVSGLRFKALSGVTLTPAAFTLAPMGTQTVTIAATPQASGAGLIVYYDLTTGSTYAQTLLTITKW
jgi:subtilisin family serine protease